jgi:proline iminopeptidase
MPRLPGATIFLALCLSLCVAVAGCGAIEPQRADQATPQGIDEAVFVRIGGADQWITIRGRDRRNPVVLVLHGGPGGAMSHLIARMQPMEHDYVVVQWDQPGAGKTLTRAGSQVDPKLDLATMVRDGAEVTQYLRRHLARDKVILVGWSWGSFLGVQMAEAHPGLYAAFVGTGQAASAQPDRDRWIYADLLSRTRAAGDAKGLAEVEAIGPPPWKDPTAPGRLWRVSAPYRGASVPFAEIARAALTAPNWSLADAQGLLQGRRVFKDTVLEREIWSVDYARFGRALTIPVLLVQGERDMVAPSDHARTWLARLDTPRKALVLIPAAGHDAILTDTAAFTRALNAELPKLLGPEWRKLRSR